MPYSKHTNMELLAVCYNCIGNLVKALNRLEVEFVGPDPTGPDPIARPIADALRDELYKRTKGVTFETGRTHGE